MSETLTPEDFAERLTRINQMLAATNLANADTDKRRQDIRFAPLTLLWTGVGAGAALAPRWPP